jgi:hypothetical protein
MNLRNRRTQVLLACHSAPIGTALLGIVLGGLLTQDGLAQGSVVFLALYLLTLRRNPFPRAIERSVLQIQRCEWCHNDIPLTGPWQCTNCRFLPRDRHAFDTCPGCGHRWMFIECPFDGTHILL